MARTINEIAQEHFGHLMLQLTILQANIEALQEEVNKLKEAKNGEHSS